MSQEDAIVNILIFEFSGGVLNSIDVQNAFKRAGISYHIVSYTFADTNDDEFFKYRFKKVLSEGKFDAVFNINYFPLIAECCYEMGIKYLAWSFDNPLNATRVEKTFGFETNYIFLFDRIQAEGYLKQGFKHIYHLPLAADCDRLDQITFNQSQKDYYGAPISFVGILYGSNLDEFMQFMTDFQRGYIDALIAASTNLYGCFPAGDSIADKFIDEINEQYKKVLPGQNPIINRDWLLHQIGMRATRRERLLLISMLSNRYNFKLFSSEQPPIPLKAQFMGTCNYLTEMPIVFKASDINLNITLKEIQSGIPLRIMDIMGCSGFLMSNYQPELLDYFVNGKDVVVYDSLEDACDKADFYLQHPELIEEVRLNGYKRIRENFTYDQRLKYIFETAGLG